MLDVYTYRVQKPAQCIDFSITALDTLTDEAIAVYSHQTHVHIWFGYLEGWMLTPREEVLMRNLIRKFPCSLVTAFPLSLSQSWKNEIRTIYTDSSYGHADSHNDGRAVYNRCEAGYGSTRGISPSHEQHH